MYYDDIRVLFYSKRLKKTTVNEIGGGRLGLWCMSCFIFFMVNMYNEILLSLTNYYFFKLIIIIDLNTNSKPSPSLELNLS